MEAGRRLGIDRWTVKRWVGRGRQLCEYMCWRGVKRPSTGPRDLRAAVCRNGSKIKAWREATSLCQEISAVLANVLGLSVSASSIHRYPRKSGLVRPNAKRRRPFFQNGQVMSLCNCSGLGNLQMDKECMKPGQSRFTYTSPTYGSDPRVKTILLNLDSAYPDQLSS